MASKTEKETPSDKKTLPEKLKELEQHIQHSAHEVADKVRDKLGKSHPIEKGADHER